MQTQAQPQGDGLALLAQLGLLQDPIKQLGGLLDIMLSIENADRQAQSLDLQERGFNAQQEYQSENLELDRRKIDLAEQNQPMEDNLRRAQMLTHLRSTGVPVNPAAMQNAYGLAGFGENIFDIAAPQNQFNNPQSQIFNNALLKTKGLDQW